MDFSKELLDSLQSYLPEPLPDLKTVSRNKETFPKLLTKTAATELSSVAAQTNEAATRLLSLNGQEKIAKRMEQVNQEEHEARLVTKHNKAVAVKKKKKESQARPAPDVSAAVPLVGAKEVNTDTIPMPDCMPADGSHIEKIEQHMMRDNELELFAKRVDRPHGPSTEMITKTPPLVKTLQYCSQFPDLTPWVNQYNATLANSSTLSFQRMPTLSRAVLQTFLRVPDPRHTWERPCFNLDREPRVGEGLMRCAAHRLSEERLGPGKGYRLREILYPEQIVAINHTLANKGDASAHLYPIPEMCYLCHIYLATEKCLEQKNKQAERKESDLTVDSTQKRTEMVGIVNRFIVTVGSEGEYDLRRMLVSDDLAMGVFGPFPMWSTRHYECAVMSDTKLAGFAENDVLVFRLSREPSELIESTFTSGSTRSTPTRAPQDIMSLRQ
jgi:hypothetical protein